MNLQPADCITTIKPYPPGKPIEEVEREYGVSGSIKLASNENPLGPSPKAVEAIQKALRNLHRYPDAGGYYLTRKLAETLKVSPDQIVLGNGSDDVIGMLTRVYLKPGDTAVMADPSFLMYDIFVRTAGAFPVKVPLRGLAMDLDAMAGAVTETTKLMFITNPNNPTGGYVTENQVAAFLSRLPKHVVVVLDEAYIEFATAPDCLDGLRLVSDDRPIAVMRTFSKAYGLAGVRIGYGVMPAEMAAWLHRIRQPFNVNSLAQVAACAALDDTAFLEQTKTLIRTELAFLKDRLFRMGVSFFPTQANFFLIDVKHSSSEVFEALIRRGVIVRPMTAYGYPEYIRLTVGTREENLRFLEALDQVLKGRGGMDA